MKAKINPETGKVEWIGRGSGENWVSVPSELPEQEEPSESLHYDDDLGFYYD